MAGILVNTGINAEMASDSAAQVAYKIHLYQNNHAPAAADLVGAYTEATYDGYSSQTIGAGVTTPAAGGIGSIKYGPFTFLDLGAVTPNNIYGYYITDSTGAVLIGAELFGGGPYLFNANGVGIQVTVTEQIQSP
jgi:hypothetical protein